MPAASRLARSGLYGRWGLRDGMRNPVRRLKEIFGELLLNGQQSRLDAARMAQRFDALEQKLAFLAADAGPSPVRSEPPPAMVVPPRMESEPVFFGLDDLDRRLAAHLNCDNGYFVELGANDGVAQSNTLHFERFRGWSGVLVEPTPHNFLKCRANRSERARIFCCACTAFGYPDRFVELVFANLMSTPLGLNSDIADPMAHAEAGRQFLAPSDEVFTFGARARPLNDVLVEAGAPGAIDLLSLDVEGAELEVLQGVDHARFRFRFICVECRDLGRMSAYLADQGYELVEQLSHHDYLFRDTRR